MLHYINISDPLYSTPKKPRVAKKLQHLQIISKFNFLKINTLNPSQFLPEIVSL